MKKINAAVLAMLLCISLIGCGKTETVSGESDEVTVKETEPWSNVDIDFTVFSSAVVYSEVCNMLTAPENYVGRVVKIRGNFGVYTNSDNTMKYFSVDVADATACCQQGLEFIWTGEHSFPNDYPATGTEIEVTGVFQTYMENGQTYCHLIADDLVIC